MWSLSQVWSAALWSFVLAKNGKRLYFIHHHGTPSRHTVTAHRYGPPLRPTVTAHRHGTPSRHTVTAHRHGTSSRHTGVMNRPNYLIMQWNISGARTVIGCLSNPFGLSSLGQDDWEGHSIPHKKWCKKMPSITELQYQMQALDGYFETNFQSVWLFNSLARNEPIYEWR